MDKKQDIYIISPNEVLTIVSKKSKQMIRIETDKQGKFIWVK
jgi:hypothetical protein